MKVLSVILFFFLSLFSLTSFTNKGDDDDDDDKGNSKGKNQNYLEVNTNRNLSFECKTPEDLEESQTINNAITLKFKTKKKNCSMYVQVSNYNTPRGASSNNIPLELIWNSDNSPNAVNVIRTMQLTNRDQKLFIQPKRSQTFQFRYDLRLKPVGYEYPSGRYNFVLLFTMTQP